jgi:hypothetical protein
VIVIVLDMPIDLDSDMTLWTCISLLSTTAGTPHRGLRTGGYQQLSNVQRSRGVGLRPKSTAMGGVCKRPHTVNTRVFTVSPGDKRRLLHQDIDTEFHSRIFMPAYLPLSYEIVVLSQTSGHRALTSICTTKSL